MEYPLVFLFDFNKNWKVLTNFGKTPGISNLMTIWSAWAVTCERNCLKTWRYIAMTYCLLRNKIFYNDVGKGRKVETASSNKAGDIMNRYGLKCIKTRQINPTSGQTVTAWRWSWVRMLTTCKIRLVPNVSDLHTASITRLDDTACSYNR